MVSAAAIRACIDEHIRDFNDAGGVGPDAYSSSALVHPMADGKFLSVLALLRRENLLSEARFRVSVEEPIRRLESQAIPCETGLCWGLGFAWRELPPNEPFLITSCVVTRGLLDCREMLAGDEQFTTLLASAAAGVAGWWRSSRLEVPSVGGTLPAYSPGIQVAVYNAVAYSISTVRLCFDAGLGGAAPPVDTAEGVRWLAGGRIPGLGWRYAPDNHVVDLLHQCYILNALCDIGVNSDIERFAMEVVGQFAGPCCFADALTWHPEGTGMTVSREIPWVRPLGAGHVQLMPKPARLWSLGELLVVTARLAAQSEHPSAWLRLGSLISEKIIERLGDTDDAERQYPRHVMHALHGLACQLRLLRSVARAKSSSAGLESP